MQLIYLIWFGLLIYTSSDDPAPALFHPKSVSRTYECERLGVEAAHRRYPGAIAAPGPRGDYAERSALVCVQRILRPGLREAQDEAVLSSLEDSATALAQAASSLRPELQDRTWLVEAYYPDTQVAAKIAFATKNALVAQGLGVSDRTPLLGFGDIQTLTRLGPAEAYPAACQRYAANGSLGERDTLLAVLSLDPRETTLHAGLCSQGSWTWLP